MASYEPPFEPAREFIVRDEELEEKSKEVKRIRKARKEYSNTIMQYLESQPEGQRFIELPDGTTLSLEVKERKVPINREFVARKLSEYLDNADIVSRLTAAIVDDRDTVTSMKIVRDK